MSRNLIISLFILCSTISFGQSENTFSLISHAGLSGTQVQGDGLGGFNKLGIMLGLGVEMKTGKQFDVGFEMNLVQKGSKRNPDPENNDYIKYKMVLTYIQVPIYLKYSVTDKISALAGPSIGFLVANKEEDFNGSFPSSPEFNSIDFSALVGARYSFTERFGAEVRFEQSIIPIRSKESTSSMWLDGKQFNTALGLYLSYTIK